MGVCEDFSARRDVRLNLAVEGLPRGIWNDLSANTGTALLFAAFKDSHDNLFADAAMRPARFYHHLMSAFGIGKELDCILEGLRAGVCVHGEYSITPFARFVKYVSAQRYAAG